jgi:hypothetical protein
MDAPHRMTLDEPEPLLRWLSSTPPPSSISLDNAEVAEIWGLVALAALARARQWDPKTGAVRGHQPIQVDVGTEHHVSRFAHAVGFRDATIGTSPITEGVPGRTVKITRIRRFEQIEPTAGKIGKLLVSDDSLLDVRRTLSYVVIELLRNVVQHSRDPLGGVVAAQRNDRGRSRDRPVIQVAVADSGIGVPEHLKLQHPSLTEPEEALDKALWPHFSGTFEEGLTGTQENAGMGLFFIAEMAKLLAGELLIASRGATLLLKGDPSFNERHELRFLKPQGTGYPGTLVAFELPYNEALDYDSLIERIRERAQARTPQRAVHKWIRYDIPRVKTQRFIVRIAAEDTGAAVRFSRENLLPRIMERRAIELDFSDIDICTQSFLHSLLYEPLRIAWALRVPIYVAHIKPGVRSNLELLQNYALGG